MIVYSDRRRDEDPRDLIAALLGRLEAPSSDDDLTAILIATGALESSLTDALAPEIDDEPPPARALNAATLDAAHAARLPRGPGRDRRLASLAGRLRVLAGGPLPPRVEVSEPEGFAFYALYPEAYAEAARRFARAARPARVTCIGLRSIGTTLAAVVAAALEAEGVLVRCLSVRPRGHPFDRQLRLGPEVERALADGAGSHVLVVDEGPGLSGSSMTCVAAAAARAGAPDGRIVLFPSWDADGSALRSEAARDRWPRHPRWVVGFEELFVERGRLAATWGGGPLRDLSGGLWRDLLLPSGSWPAVQPQHERRKYLLDRGDGALLLRFAGLGERGRRALDRAGRHAEAGIAPPVVGLADGFLAHRFVPGRPAGAGDPDEGLLDAMAGYLALLAREEPPAGPPRFEALIAMTRTNVAEGLGAAAARLTDWMEGRRSAVALRPAIAGDGRMPPHEWLVTPGGVLKCDGLDHHDDHFFPGPQDVAWDLAGAMVEWGLGADARRRLLDGYRARSGDRGVGEVLGFYEAAYLAWRLGYATLAAESVPDPAEAGRLRSARDRYAAGLRRALSRAA